MFLKRILFCFLLIISSLFVKLNVFADNFTYGISYNYTSGSDVPFNNSPDLYFKNSFSLIKYLKEDKKIDFHFVIYDDDFFYLCNDFDLENMAYSKLSDLKLVCNSYFKFYYFYSNFTSDNFSSSLNDINATYSSSSKSFKFFDQYGLNYLSYKFFWQDGTVKFPYLDFFDNNTINFTRQYFLDFFSYGNDRLFTENGNIISYLYRYFGYDYISNDVFAPVINLIGNSEINIEINSIFNDPGYNCTDNVDSSCNVIVSGNVDTSKLGSYTLTYSATDLAGNNSKVTRVVNVIDSINPVITLFGDSIIYCNINGEYDELGASVTDNSNEILDVVIDSSLLDIRKVGDYKISYSACDSSDNCTTIYRLVKVQSTIPADFSGSQYLLFNFSDIQDLFPNIDFSGVSNSDQFVITIIFNIFFVIFIFFFIYLFIKVINKIISIVFH